MIRIACFLVLIGMIASCKKSNNDLPPVETMTYIDLQQAEVKTGVAQRVDPDDNGTLDFTFSSRTVNDATLNQTRFEFFVTSRVDAYLLMTTGTQNGKKFNKGDSIMITAPNGTAWSTFAFMIMSQKITPQSSPSYWQGDWKDASHHFLPIRVTRNGKVYTGWIEISMEIATERMILHKTAISIDPDKNARAGY